MTTAREALTDDEIIALAVKHKLGRTMKPLGMQTGDVFVTDQSYRTGELLAFARAVLAQPEAPGWQPAETLPKEPRQWIAVQETCLYRWLPYKPNSTEARRGKRGRWQKYTGYGFDNAEPPHGPWRIGEEDFTPPKEKP